MTGVNTTPHWFFFFFNFVKSERLHSRPPSREKYIPTAAIVLMDLNRKKNLVVSS